MTKYTSAFNITLENGQRTTIALSPFELKMLKIMANYKDLSVQNYVLMAIKRGEIDGMFNRSRAVVDQLLTDFAKSSCVLGVFVGENRL